MTSTELKKLLANYNIKKRELASELGYSWIAVHKWCKAERLISPKVERFILRGLHDIIKRRKDGEEETLVSIKDYIRKYLEEHR